MHPYINLRFYPYSCFVHDPRMKIRMVEKVPRREMGRRAGKPGMGRVGEKPRDR
jgi:hypothetical protein